MPAVSRFQKYVTERWDRRRIASHKRNPRKITPEAKKRLKEYLASNGLLEAVTVNRRTCKGWPKDAAPTLVGGHQRLAILDALEGSAAYSLDLCVVDLPPKKEAEALLALNNPAMQGQWDVAAFVALATDKENPIKLEDAGFDAMDVEMIAGEVGEGIFGKDNPEVEELLSDMEKMRDERKSTSDSLPPGEREAEADAAFDRRQGIRDTTDKKHTESDQERFGFVVFPTREAREDWVESLGLGRNERYVPCAALGIKIAPAKGKIRGRRSSS